MELSDLKIGDVLKQVLKTTEYMVIQELEGGVVLVFNLKERHCYRLKSLSGWQKLNRYKNNDEVLQRCLAKHQACEENAGSV